MDFRFAEDEEAFRKEVQDFLQESLLADWLGGDPDAHYEQAVEELHQFELEMRRKLAAKGWLRLMRPKEYGGQQAPSMKQLILEEEIMYRGAPYWALSATCRLAGMPALTRGLSMVCRWALTLSTGKSWTSLTRMRCPRLPEANTRRI